MTTGTRAESAGHLVAALDHDELVALEWAAMAMAGLCDWPYPGADHDETLATGRRLRALGPTLRDAIKLKAALAAGFDTDHDCTSCGTPLVECDQRIASGRRACCTSCSTTDTHADTPSGFAERQRARAAAEATAQAADIELTDAEAIGLKVYNGLQHRVVPGVERHRVQVFCIVAAHSKTAAARIAGVTRHEFARSWAEGGGHADTLAAVRAPGTLLYRPLDAHRAPLVPWAEQYPIESVPRHLRDPGLEKL